MLKLPN